MQFKNDGLREMGSPSSICDQRKTLEIKKTQSCSIRSLQSSCWASSQQLKYPLYSLKMQEAHSISNSLPATNSFTLIPPMASTCWSHHPSADRKTIIPFTFSQSVCRKQEPCAKYNLRTVPWKPPANDRRYRGTINIDFKHAEPQRPHALHNVNDLPCSC